MNMKQLVFGSALLSIGLASAPAFATPPNVTDLGSISTGNTNFSASIAGNGGSSGSPGPAFTVDWKFSLAGDPTYVSIFLSGAVSASLNAITNGVLSLYSCSGSCGATPSGGTLVESGSLVDTSVFNRPNPPNHVVSVNQTGYVGNATVYGDLLSAGNYYFALTGNYNNAVHATADAITGNVTVTAVPEASTWLMMLTGFAGLAFAAYRRTGRSAGPLLPI